MSKLNLGAFCYWTALPTIGVLLAACGDDVGVTPLPNPNDAGRTEETTSNPQAESTSDEAVTNGPTPGPTSNSSSAASGSEASLPSSNAPTSDGSSAQPSDSTGLDSEPSMIRAAFPLGLAVESLLSREEAQQGNFLNWQNEGVEVSAEAQISKALSASDVSDCAVILPPLSSAHSPSCYGPSLNYQNHPDGECTPPPGVGGEYCQFPSGDLGLWSATEAGSSEACTAAKFNADVNAVGFRVDAALLIAASAVCGLSVEGVPLPGAGETLDASATLTTSLTVHQPGLQVLSAAITNGSSIESPDKYTYSIAVQTQNGQTILFTLDHTSTGVDTYVGRLWGEVKQSSEQPLNPSDNLQQYLVSDAGPENPFDGGMAPPPCTEPQCGPCIGPECPPVIGCDAGYCPPPPCEGNDCPPPPCEGVDCPPPPCEGNDCPPPPCEGMDCPPPPCEGDCPPPPCEGMDCPPPPCEGDNCPPPPCEGNDCPVPPPVGNPEGGDSEVFSVSYELTSDKHLRTRMLTKNGAVGGEEAFTIDGSLAPNGAWTRSMSLTVLDVDQTTNTGKGAYLWQAGPFDNRTRVFNVFTHVADDGSKSGCGYFGFGAPFGETLPALGIENFICNWAGPGNNHDGIEGFAQKQCMAPNAYGMWEPTLSLIAYAPSNSCGSDDPSFAGGSGTPDSWTPFATTSDLVDLTSDLDYGQGFGDGPMSPSL